MIAPGISDDHPDVPRSARARAATARGASTAGKRFPWVPKMRRTCQYLSPRVDDDRPRSRAAVCPHRSCAGGCPHRDCRRTLRRAHSTRCTAGTRRTLVGRCVSTAPACDTANSTRSDADQTAAHSRAARGSSRRPPQSAQSTKIFHCLQRRRRRRRCICRQVRSARVENGTCRRTGIRRPC